MKQVQKQILLDEEDIKQVIANSYDVGLNKVSIETYVDVEGYGLGEHYVTKVRATVETPMNDAR